jgi:hypothetical protein
LSEHSTPAEDGSSRLEDARKMRRALDSFGQGYARSKVQLDRNLLIERIEALRKEMMQKVETVKSTMTIPIPGYEEEVHIISKYNEDSKTLFFADKSNKSKNLIKWFYEQSQRNTFYVPPNNFYSILDELISDVQKAKLDKQLQSHLDLLLHDRIQDFAQTKYGWEYVRILGEDIWGKHAHKKRKFHRSSVIRSLMQSLLGKGK